MTVCIQIFISGLLYHLILKRDVNVLSVLLPSPGSTCTQNKIAVWHNLLLLYYTCTEVDRWHVLSCSRYDIFRLRLLVGQMRVDYWQ